MPRAKQRTPELRDRVLHVAVAMLDDEGVVGFTARNVARGAQTSVPAVYELFGDKAGLLREVFFEGFRQLRRRFDPLVPTDDARGDLVRVIEVLRAFGRENPVLAEVMFSRPFADFDPGPEERAATASVREFIVDRVQRGVDERVTAGDATDIAHILLALAQGLAAQENAGWLGTTNASRDRRWELAVNAIIDGFAPGAGPARTPARTNN